MNEQKTLQYLKKVESATAKEIHLQTGVPLASVYGMFEGVKKFSGRRVIRTVDENGISYERTLRGRVSGRLSEQQLVEEIPNSRPKQWEITDAGRQEYERLNELVTIEEKIVGKREKSRGHGWQLVECILQDTSQTYAIVLYPKWSSKEDGVRIHNWLRRSENVNALGAVLNSVVTSLMSVGQLGELDRKVRKARS